MREDEGETATATEQDQTTVMNVFPNPVESQLNIAVEQNFESDASLELYSITGQLLRREDVVIGVGTTSMGWTLDELPAGTYILSLRQASGELSTQKIIKQ